MSLSTSLLSLSLRAALLSAVGSLVACGGADDRVESGDEPLPALSSHAGAGGKKTVNPAALPGLHPGGSGQGAGGSGQPGAGGPGQPGASGSPGQAAGPQCGFSTGLAPCDACLAGSCCAESQACSGDEGCVGFNGCIGQPGCQGGACDGACSAQFPSGAAAHASLLQCLSNRCASACGGGAGNPGTAGAPGSGSPGSAGAPGAPGGGGSPGGGAPGGGGSPGGAGAPGTIAPPAGGVVPPLNDSSHGSGGPHPLSGEVQTAQGVEYRLIVPASYSPSQPAPLLLVYSGVEGGAVMTNNLMSIAAATGIDGFVRAVLDGAKYNGNASAGATVLDEVRARYNIDNDRTYLLGESAGTKSALSLGLSLRQSYFAAYWANDVNASLQPALSAAQLGFQPWGQAGPGGQTAHAQAIVGGMAQAGYRVPDPAPYNGPGATKHGDPQQFIAALSWFADKSRH